MAEMMNKKLVLENGMEFPGYGFGADRDAIAELVYNTSMVGYQEIVSENSYYEQMVVMTYPIIGSYGVNDEDDETKNPNIGGLIVRDYNDMPSNFRYPRTLSEATNSTETIYETGTALLEAEALPQPVRLIGLGVSGFGSAPTQELLPGVFRGVRGRDPEQEARRRRLDAALDNLRDKFGKQAVQRGRLFRPREDDEDD